MLDYHYCHPCSPLGGVIGSDSRRKGVQLSDPATTFSSARSAQSVVTAASGWESRKEKLLRVSDVASMLCVLDCTILPVVMLLLPLVGVAATPGQSAWLHELGHRVALFFVLPVGGMAASLNYLSHQRLSVSLLALLGVCLIYAANAPHGAPVVSLLPHAWAHDLHCGSWIHRATNLTGCGLLLGSNYAGHRLGKGCAASELGGTAVGMGAGGRSGAGGEEYRCCWRDHKSRLWGALSLTEGARGGREGSE